MKKINVYFIGECIIIVLLLAILGLLINDRGTLMKGNVAKEASAQEQNVEKHTTVVGSQVSGVQEVADIVSGEEILEEEQVTVAVTEAEQFSSVLAGKKIVVFGDSIWNDARGTDGVSEQLMTMTGSTVYNCAIGGTSAALVGDNPTHIQDWDDCSFNGMVHIANKIISGDRVLKGKEACEVIKQVDFATVDYILVSYGLNDFFSDVPVYPKFYYDINSYIGALRNGILNLKEHYPQAQIVLVTPTYTQMFEGERTYRIGDYVEAMRSVATEMNTELADMFHIMGSDPASRMEHLADGVHLSAEGRTIYAQGIAWCLTEIEKEKRQIQ